MHNPFTDRHNEVAVTDSTIDAYNGLYLVKDLSNMHITVETVPGGCRYAVGEICKKYGNNIEIKATTETPGVGRIVYPKNL